MHLGLVVSHQARRYPDQPAVEDGERVLTYADLETRANRLAAMLEREHGVRPGDRVALLVLNRLEVIELLVATWKLGAIVASLNFRLSATDLDAIVDNAEPRLLITQAEYTDLVSPVAERRGLTVLWLDDAYEARVGHDDEGAEPWSPPEVEPEADAAIIYTSGTTGRPKGATFTHAAVLHHAANVVIEYDLDRSSRYLISIPHNSSINITIAPCLYVGATLLLTEVRAFDGAAFLETLDRRAVTHTQVVPTMLYRVLEAWRQCAVDVPSIRTIGYGSAPIPPERVAEALEAFGPVFVQLYGMTEVAAMGTMLRKDEHPRGLAGETDLLASAGQASYGIDVRVVDDDGRDVPEGERGEVAFKGSYVMRGYWREPELTADALRGGWMYSGDIGTFRRGFLHIVDRKKDLIIRGGQNLASKEVEEAVYMHPAVLEAAVVGVPEAEWGEEIVAAIVLREGAAATAEEIRQTCAASGLERFKVPSRVVFVDDLPRNSIGKIQKGVLRDQLRPASDATSHVVSPSS